MLCNFNGNSIKIPQSTLAHLQKRSSSFHGNRKVFKKPFKWSNIKWFLISIFYIIFITENYQKTAIEIQMSCDKISTKQKNISCFKFQIFYATNDLIFVNLIGSFSKKRFTCKTTNRAENFNAKTNNIKSEWNHQHIIKKKRHET